jgi:hypothetical protein
MKKNRGIFNNSRLHLVLGIFMFRGIQQASDMDDLFY